MKTLLFTIFSCLVVVANAQITLMPNISIQIDFYHPMGYKDSIVIGLSLNADDGYDEGLDVIDTSALEFPLDVRIYDPTVQQQIGGPTEYNLKHSYLALPDVPRGEIFKHYKAFQVIVASDDINFNANAGPSYDCESLSQGLGSTYFRGNITDTEFLETYEFHNSEGWAGSSVGVFSDNVFFHANFDRFDSGFSDDSCISFNSENIGTSYAYLTFDIWLINWLYIHPVSVLENQTDFKIQFINDQLIIRNSLSVSGIYIFDLYGKLLFKDQNHQTNSYQRNLPIQPALQPYVLMLSDSDQRMIFTQKVLPANY